jgi:hypothetical protein
MALKVVWTTNAEKGYDKIIQQLLIEWTIKEVSNFIMETKLFLSLLEKNTLMLQSSEIRKNIFRGTVNRLTILTYRLKSRWK